METSHGDGVLQLYRCSSRGNQRQANLRALIDKAVAFQARSGGGIYEFLTYVDAVNKVVDIGQAKLLSEQDDVVRIMTIHKSKGLEFPAVIVTGLGKSLTRRYGKNGRITLHKDIGFGLSRVKIFNRAGVSEKTEVSDSREELDRRLFGDDIAAAYRKREDEALKRDRQEAVVFISVHG